MAASISPVIDECVPLGQAGQLNKRCARIDALMRLSPFWRLLPGAVLVLSAWSSSALTVGRVQGQALIGRPLEIAIPVGLDVGALASDLCADTEVFYGENRVDARRVDLRASSSGAAGMLRLRVATPVDEAFVSVVLKVGCQQRLTRRYELLTEYPVDLAEAAAVAAPVALAAAPVSSAVAPLAPLAVAPVAPRPPVAESRVAPRVVAVEPAPAPAPARAAAPKAAPAPKPAPVPAPVKPVERPRLKLDALDVRPVGDAPLKVSRSLQETGTATTPQRAEATATWQALNTPPEDLMRSTQRMQSLELDIRALRDSMLKSQAQMVELRNRLERAERERYANGLVYALAGLLAAAAALAAFLWHRGRTRAPAPSQWWIDSQQSLTPAHADALAPAAPADPIAPAPAAVPAASAATRPLAEVPAANPAPVAAAKPAPAEPAVVIRSAHERPASSFDVAAAMEVAFTTAALDTATRTFAPSGSDGLRLREAAPVTIEHLALLQADVDALCASGQADRALALLREHIDAHPQASALAWLNLLDIQHRLARRAEYEQLRHDYEWLFNAKAPAFDDYKDSLAGLEQQPATLAGISARWPGPGALSQIEDAVFRRPGANADEAPPDLQTYRDLLVLHAVAKDLSLRPAATASTVLAAAAAAASSATAPAPLLPDVDLLLPGLEGDDGIREASMAADQGFDVLDLNAGLDLDINLDELDPATAQGEVLQAPALRDSNLLDFDLDLGDAYPLPGNNKG